MHQYRTPAAHVLPLSVRINAVKLPHLFTSESYFSPRGRLAVRQNPRQPSDVAVLAILLTLFIVIWTCWFIVTTFFASTWRRQVDEWHDYFLRHGWLSRGVSDELKVMEKGFALPMVIAATILLAVMALTVLVLAPLFD